MRRVVVTGFGAVTPCGLDVPSMWRSFMECQSGIGLITLFDAAEYSSRIAGEVKGFDLDRYVPKKDQRQMDRFIHFAIAAADEAMKHSGLVVDDRNRDRIGTLVGVGLGGLTSIEKYRDVVRDSGPRKISPYFIPMVISNLAPGHISMRFGIKGPSMTITTACASSTHALGDAMRWIKLGYCDAMLAGGAESTISPLGVGGFCAMRALSTRNDAPAQASRPFDKDRDGFVIAEGAGILVLEELECAKRRGATIYAELVGYGATADAYHLTQPGPEGEGAARCMKMALDDGGLQPGEVDYINAHGTSTPLNDKFETMAVKTVFGDQARKLAISSTKSMTGHLLGAAGGVEAIASVLSIHHQMAPPTINYTTPDPECDLDYVPNEPRKMAIRAVISNSLGFGGTNATIAFKRFGG